MLNDFTTVLESKREEITNWMKSKRKQVPIPVYGSVDVRDAGWKVGVVDANHFPAGFNNIPKENIQELALLFGEHVHRTHPECQWIHIYPENHTRNQGYIENISTIKSMIEQAGFRCTVGSPDLNEFTSLHGLSGPLLINHVDLDENDELSVNGVQPDLILLNNDLTDNSIPGIRSANITPPPQMGWYRRRKSEHYAALRPYVNEMASILGIDPWHLMPEWFVSENKCLTEDACRIRLATEINEFLETLRQRYQKLGIEREPMAVIKNDSGTYGLGVMVLKSGDDILNLSNRKANRLRYAKGGAAVENFLIQEGIPTALTSKEGETLEPVVYLVDGEAASWFYRINAKKSDMDNLNSPSARFEHYADSLNPYHEQAQGWHALVAELSMLAMGAEAAQLDSEAPPSANETTP
jgi:glutamate--cysteine ligase